jgi:hypothetical protein
MDHPGEIPSRNVFNTVHAMKGARNRKTIDEPARQALGGGELVHTGHGAT